MCKIDEDLLKSGLAHRVIFDGESLSDRLDDAEQSAELHGRVGDVEMEQALMHVLENGSRKTGFDRLLDLSDSGFSRLFFAALHLDHQSVTFAKLALEVLGAAQTSELAVDHDRDSRTQRFTLFHAVGYKTSQRNVLDLYRYHFLITIPISCVANY